jgi:adenylate cyclase
MSGGWPGDGQEFAGTDGSVRPDDQSIPVEERRAQALARVRSLLLDLGATEEEISRAVADDTVDLLMVDRMLVPAERRMTQNEVVERTGIPLDVATRIWRALGFLGVGDADPVFTEMDIEALHLFQAMMAMGLVDVETGLHMARVIGSSMARIAEAETAPGSAPVMATSGDSVLDADEFARSAGASLPAMARLLEYVWRRHLQAATRRAMLLRLRSDDSGISPVMAVGFADMVGFTMLSQHLGDRDLAAVVSRFEELAHDIVISMGGRVVKMIGDEAMFVVSTAADAARIGLALAEAYADDALLSDVRVAMAFGPVLVQDGDYYGPVVNLASRLVGIANAGTVLLSDELHDALEGEAPGEFTTKALRPRSLKDIGRVQVWKLARADATRAAERRRSVPWERLGDVLRELDDLRETGERVVGHVPPRPGRDPSVESDGGDTVRPEFEPPFERHEGTSA